MAVLSVLQLPKMAALTKPRFRCNLVVAIFKHMLFVHCVCELDQVGHMKFTFRKLN